MSVEFHLTKELIKELDELTDSPAVRATKVSNILANVDPPLSTADILSFCVLTLAYDETMRRLAYNEIKSLGIIFHQAHYYSLYLEREEMKDAIHDIDEGHKKGGTSSNGTSPS